MSYVYILYVICIIMNNYMYLTIYRQMCIYLIIELQNIMKQIL